MIPRGQLDISYSHLFRGLAATLEKQQAAEMSDPSALICLSVRTGFDMILSALDLPAGAEVIIGDINIPGMFDIIKAHKLVAVPLPLDKYTLNISPELFSKAVSANTRVAVFSHLFGARMELDPLIEIARSAGIFTIEDCAQAFTGSSEGHPEVDASLFSFGMIKTNTSLGGAVLRLKDRALLEQVAAIHKQMPLQPTKSYQKKLLTALLIKLICNRPVYKLFFMVLKALKKDPDLVLSGFTRGFPGGDVLLRIRRRPCATLRFMVQHRLDHFDKHYINSRIQYGRQILSALPETWKIGSANRSNSFWVLPIDAADPSAMVIVLRAAGFDATSKASSMIKMANLNVTAPYPEELHLKGVVYLPMWPQLSSKQRLKLIDIVEKQSKIADD